MKKRNMWILVADAARARAFALRSERTLLDEVETRLDPAWQHQLIGDRRESREIASDRPGRSFDSAGQGRHAMEPPTDPARYEAQRFAREVVRSLDDARKANAFEDLVIVAPPQFLGDLRASMPAPLQQCVRAEVNKDLSKLKPAQILQHLQDVI